MEFDLKKIGEINKIRIQNVYNLYGGIFEYKNEEGKVVNNQIK
jgi:hypothetical protein